MTGWWAVCLLQSQWSNWNKETDVKQKPLYTSLLFLEGSLFIVDLIWFWLSKRIFFFEKMRVKENFSVEKKIDNLQDFNNVGVTFSDDFGPKVTLGNKPWYVFSFKHKSLTTCLLATGKYTKTQDFIWSLVK